MNHFIRKEFSWDIKFLTDSDLKKLKEEQKSIESEEGLLPIDYIRIVRCDGCTSSTLASYDYNDLILSHNRLDPSTVGDILDVLYERWGELGFQHDNDEHLL